VTNLNFRPQNNRISFPTQRVDVRQQALNRLYERKATLEALIDALEAYARCRVPAEVETIPLRGN